MFVSNFCFELGKTASETHDMFEIAFGKGSWSNTNTQVGFKFKDGQTSVEDEHHGRPSTRKTNENTERIWGLINQGTHLTIHDL